MSHIFRIDLKSGSKFKQLNWFLNNYSSIFDSLDIKLYFQNFTQFSEFKENYNNKSSKVKTYIFNNFTTPMSVDQIRDFELFDYIVIPFRNKYSESALTTFTSNLDKIKDRSKIICVIDYRDFENLEKIAKILKICNSLRFTKIVFQYMNESDKNYLQKTLDLYKQSIIDLEYNIKYIIDEQGNILNPSNKLLSSIYKQPAYLIFN